MTESRELTNYCQSRSVPHPSLRRSTPELEVPEAMDLVVNAVIADNARRAMRGEVTLEKQTQGFRPICS